MYDQNFKNQAVKEVKNGSSVASTARKFDIAITTLNGWIGTYDENIYEITRKKKTNTVMSPVTPGINLQSIKVQIDGTTITLKRHDVLKMLNIFNIFDERVGEE